MLCPAARLTVAAFAAVSMLPASTAVAAPNPNPHLSQVLAAPPSTGYVELASHTPGILEGPFDAGTYASIGGIDMQSTINTLAKDGFIGGFGRAWVQQSPSRVMVEIVVAFTGGSGAKQWLQQSQLADLTDPTFPHSGWPGANASRFTISNAAALAPRVTAWLVAGAALWWLALVGARRFQRRRSARALQDSSGL